MSLRRGQSRMLYAIEADLVSADPHLASMFAIFTSLTSGEKPVGLERISRGRWHRLASPRRWPVLDWLRGLLSAPQRNDTMAQSR